MCGSRLAYFRRGLLMSIGARSCGYRRTLHEARTHAKTQLAFSAGARPASQHGERATPAIACGATPSGCRRQRHRTMARAAFIIHYNHFRIPAGMSTRRPCANWAPTSKWSHIGMCAGPRGACFLEDSQELGHGRAMDARHVCGAMPKRSAKLRTITMADRTSTRR